jgi:hypothetical protein
MEILKKMLFEREHPLTIISFIKNNYEGITKDENEEFLKSLLNPELLKPMRYPGMIPTKTFFIDKDYNVAAGTNLKIYLDCIFTYNYPKSNLLVNDKYIYSNSVESDGIKMYRITAACILTHGDFKLDGKVYSNQKIIYVPDSEQWMDFKFVNSDKSNYEIVLDTISQVKLTIIQHVEFIPVNKLSFKTKAAKYLNTLFDEKFKYKKLIITNYDMPKNSGFDDQKFVK